MNYETPSLGDTSFSKFYNDLRRRSEFSEAIEEDRQEMIYHFASNLSTSLIETQLEALSGEEILQKDPMFTEYLEMSRIAKEKGQYDEYQRWEKWRRDMRSLHRGLARVYKERLDEKVARLAPKQPKKKKSFLGIFDL